MKWLDGHLTWKIITKESPQKHYRFEFNSHISNFWTSWAIICFQWRFWASGRELSVSYVGGWAAVSRRGATNTTELWKALRSTHALSKEVWHIAPDGNLKKGKTRELHWIQSISVMNSIAEGEECNFCATGGIKRNRTTLKRLKWCLPMQNWQQRCQCVAMRLLGCSGWLLGEMHFKPPG